MRATEAHSGIVLPAWFATTFGLLSCTIYLAFVIPCLLAPRSSNQEILDCNVEVVKE